MDFNLPHAIEILTATPPLLRQWLGVLSPEWTMANEGNDTWSAYDIIGHLIHGEQTDWIPRVRMILEHGDQRPFTPFDRFAQFENSKGKSLLQLLKEFEQLRKHNLLILDQLPISGHLDKAGLHPALGKVNLRQLLASWVVHDLSHIHQLSRVLAHQYKDEVGPWKEYMGVISKS